MDIVQIFARLEELHMSQIELSRRTGIATSTISDWRKKKINPQADKLVSICKALDMSLVDLLCDEEVKSTIGSDFMVDGQHIIEIFSESDPQTKRRLLRYFELLEFVDVISMDNLILLSNLHSEVWLLMLKKRKTSVHIYNEEEVDEMILLIRERFIPGFTVLKDTLGKQLDGAESSWM